MAKEPIKDIVSNIILVGGISLATVGVIHASMPKNFTINI